MFRSEAIACSSQRLADELGLDGFSISSGTNEQLCVTPPKDLGEFSPFGAATPGQSSCSASREVSRQNSPRVSNASTWSPSLPVSRHNSFHGARPVGTSQSPTLLRDEALYTEEPTAVQISNPLHVLFGSSWLLCDCTLTHQTFVIVPHDSTYPRLCLSTERLVPSISSTGSKTASITLPDFQQYYEHFVFEVALEFSEVDQQWYRGQVEQATMTGSASSRRLARRVTLAPSNELCPVVRRTLAPVSPLTLFNDSLSARPDLDAPLPPEGGGGGNFALEHSMKHGVKSPSSPPGLSDAWCMTFRAPSLSAMVDWVEFFNDAAPTTVELV